MKKPKIARLHHYLPQFYLKGFCGNRQNLSLYCIDKEERKAFEANIKNIGAEKDFYKIDNGTEPDIYKKHLSKIEVKLSKALKKIKETSSLQGAMWKK